MKIVSACLVGFNCRYDGENKLNKNLLKLFKEGKLIPVCPEQLGGLTTPRDRARIIGGDGKGVIEGRAKVMTSTKNNVTQQYIRGSKESLKIAKVLEIKEAILKSDSPSCGCGNILSEDFSEKRQGDGVTTALFKKNGIEVHTEENFKSE
jgi:uncharacterized protein YbbK (DUF523 family)